MIKIENLVKEYGEKDIKVTAVDNVNLEIKEGEFVAIVGCSGSGKSTLLNLIGGLDTPTCGKITIDGEDISGYSDAKISEVRRKKIGIIFQAYNLLPVLNVEENIKMPVLLDKQPVDQQYIDELIEMLGLSERKNHLPNQLSGGQQQRVCIGRALANKPKIILADEPTGNLDSKNSKEVMELIVKSAKKNNQTIVLITHEADIAKMADRIITIEDGKIVE